MKAVAIVSGGMDSTTLAYKLVKEGHELQVLSIDYGQRHAREVIYARTTADKLGARHTIADLRGIKPLLGGSALTDDIPVPEGHYAADNMAQTVVPNRNSIMLSIAYSLAVVEQADLVAIGVHAGDHPIYPDCRAGFIQQFEATMRLATAGHAVPGIRLDAPFVHQTKAEIVALGEHLGVPWLDTWSCYVGGEVHCGACGTCVERREAFVLAGVPDPTPYAEDAPDLAEVLGNADTKAVPGA